VKLCNVPRCTQELELDVKMRAHGPGTAAYCFRYRVCAVHLRSLRVDFADGMCRRFCQKCSKWRVAACACAFARFLCHCAASKACRRREGLEALGRACD
jgi:hypothetical protein